MNINPEDLRIEVGIRAYEEHTGIKVDVEHIEIYPENEQFRYGVYLIHKPTKIHTYSNSERGQLKNKNIALGKLEELVSKQSIKKCVN